MLTWKVRSLWIMDCERLLKTCVHALNNIAWWWQVFEASIWVVLGCNFMGNRIHGISDHSVLYWMRSCEADGKFADKLWKNGGYENPGRKCAQGQKWISHNRFPRNPNSNEWCIRYNLTYDIYFTYFLEVCRLLPLSEADGYYYVKILIQLRPSEILVEWN